MSFESFDWNKVSTDDVIRRFPRIVSHMICESLGYFTPSAAANAVIFHKRGEPFFCEWYTSFAQGFDRSKVIEVGGQVLKSAIALRRFHKGYMADYGRARGIVERVRRGGKGPEFASWF